MVNLLDVSDDDMRLLDAFDMLLPATQGTVLQRLSVAACYAVLSRNGSTDPALVARSPERVAEAFLMRCMPEVPTGYQDDCRFEQAYLDHALPLLEHRCLALVLGSGRQDAAHAAELAADLTECATRIASDFDAPDFAKGGFVGEDTARAFIEQWRENFNSNLVRSAAKSRA